MEWIEAIQKVAQDLKKNEVDTQELRPKKMQDAMANASTKVRVQRAPTHVCVCELLCCAHRKWRTLKC